MPVKKMRVEVFDASGERYTVTFEGQVSREKALRLLDIVELLGGMPGIRPGESEPVSELPKLEKIRLIVERHFPIIWFSAKDVQTVYEKELKEPVGLSTVSTYLSRMAERGILVKSGFSNSKRYRLTVTQSTQTSTLNLTKE
jgi:hypothetical protein